MGEGVDFFAATSEDEGVSAFESGDMESGACFGDEEVVDGVLGDAVVTGEFPDVDELCLGARSGRSLVGPSRS